MKDIFLQVIPQRIMMESRRPNKSHALCIRRPYSDISRHGAS